MNLIATFTVLHNQKKCKKHSKVVLNSYFWGFKTPTWVWARANCFGTYIQLYFIKFTQNEQWNVWIPSLLIIN